MLIDLRVALLLVVLIAEVLCHSVIKKYYPDSNRIIKRLHASAHAKSFLRGCDAEPYVNLTANTTTESELFKLLKSDQYLFAIFTLEEVTLMLTNNNSDDNVTFSISLGIARNSMAMLEVWANETLIGNVTERIVPLLPTIPYYVNVSITYENISVYEARTGASDPFLYFNFSSNLNFSSTINLEQDYFVKFRHSSPIYAHYDCCESCSPWIYTRISGCSKYSARTAGTELEPNYNLPNRTDNFLFNENILVHHDGSPTFAAKIIFTDSPNLRGNRYEIGLSDTPTLFHYFFNSTGSYNKSSNGTILKREYTSPFIFNITINKDGIVTLRQPYEDNPFLIYYSKYPLPKLNPVDVKFMYMVKFHEDFIRYDFFYNCTDVLSYSDRHELSDNFNDLVETTSMASEKSTDNDTTSLFNDLANTTSMASEESTDKDTTSHTRIWEYVSKQFNTTKYDVLHIFQDSYQIYEKSVQVNEVSSDYEDNTSANTTNVSQSNDESSKGKGLSDLFKKAFVGVGSFLFIGLLKIICSLECVQNLMKGADLDDDQAKDLRKNVGHCVSKNVVEKFDFELF